MISVHVGVEKNSKIAALKKEFMIKNKKAFSFVNDKK